MKPLIRLTSTCMLVVIHTMWLIQNGTRTNFQYFLLFTELLNDTHGTYINEWGQEVALSVVETGRPVNFFYHGEYGQWHFFVYLYLKTPGENNFWKDRTAIHAPQLNFLLEVLKMLNQSAQNFWICFKSLSALQLVGLNIIAQIVREPL